MGYYLDFIFFNERVCGWVVFCNGRESVFVILFVLLVLTFLFVGTFIYALTIPDRRESDFQYAKELGLKIRKRRK